VQRSDTDGTSWPTTWRRPTTPMPEPNPSIRRGRPVVHDLHVHLVFVTTYRRDAFDTESLNRCEHITAQACTDFGATLAEQPRGDAWPFLVPVMLRRIVATAHHCTTSQIRNDPNRQGILPALKDRVSPPSPMKMNLSSASSRGSSVC